MHMFYKSHCSKLCADEESMSGPDVAQLRRACLATEARYTRFATASDALGLEEDFLVICRGQIWYSMTKK